MDRSSFARLTVLVLFLCPVLAAAAEDPLQLRVGYGLQMDRLHSAVADSLGLSMTRATVTKFEYDFRIFSVPMAGAEKPAFHVLGDALFGKRAIPVQDFAGPGFTGQPVDEVPVAEITAGIMLTLPMTMVDPGAGSRFLVGYRGGLILTGGGAKNDFPHVKQVVFGFERTRGLFQRSNFMMAYGTNEAAGREFGAHRWAGMLHLEAQLGKPFGTAPQTAGKPTPGKGASRELSSPLRLFADFQIDTDGSIGPDLLLGRVGLTWDAGSVLSRILGVAP